ncbi:hypothetical protein [Amycolatopsis mediterranei]|uniref:hypothetical protein n=1 Tax=Amycolatopsis mediterranei TaxID=33910 RepID=UPI00030B02D6|nr:hypothetical protein [Amycolatopsis mediterranei]UZF67156.1 hypothetical protein ISP_000137 [Amycolatopsis mediterranei]
MSGPSEGRLAQLLEPLAARPLGDALIYARELLSAELRALASVRGGPLRVDVIGRRLCPATLLRGFHETHPAVPLEVATLFGTAIAALRKARSMPPSARSSRCRRTSMPSGCSTSRSSCCAAPGIRGPERLRWLRPSSPGIGSGCPA